jgi:16S rRNA (guanine966-N2)-methyltransferase
LRIIGGIVRGRKLLTPGKGPDDRAIRPTSARAREAVFNIIGSEVWGANVLDLFAGTGAMGLEALSRGAATAIFVDNNSAAARLLGRNIDRCDFTDQATVVRRDATKGFGFLREFVPAAGFSLIFIDPPYRQKIDGLMLDKLGRPGILAESGLLIFEHAAERRLPEEIGRLQLVDQRRYGEAGFGFYRCLEIEA